MQEAITLPVRGHILRGMEHMPSGHDGPCPAVILLHGFTANKLQEHRMYLKLCRRLEGMGIACFRFDFLGSGESDGDFIDMTVSREIEEAKSILAMVRADSRIDPERVTLLGLSMGGLVAGVVAGDCAGDLRNLVLIAPAGTMYERMMAGPVGAMLRSGSWVTEAADAWGNLFGKAFIEDLATVDAFARARPFGGDVLIIHGTKDESVPYEVAYRYQETAFAGRATVHLIEGADHTFNRYAWECEMIDTVCDFLAQRA